MEGSNQLLRPLSRLQHKEPDDAFAQLQSRADGEQGDDGEAGEAGQDQSRGDADHPHVGGIKEEGDEGLTARAEGDVAFIFEFLYIKTIAPMR